MAETSLRRGPWMVLGWLLVACAGGAPREPAGAQQPSEPVPRAFTRVELFVANLEVGPPDHLVIDPDGAMRLVRMTNAVDGAVDAAGIGFFETRLRPDQVRALARALVGLEDLPDHWGRLVPDDRVRRVKVEWQGEQRALERVVGTREPVDARLVAMFARLEGMSKRAAEHPRETVGITLDSVTPGAEGLGVARVKVRATGTWPIRVPGLRALLGDRGALSMMLGAARGVVEVPVLDVVEGPDPDGLRLAPGEEASFDVSFDPRPLGAGVTRAAVVMRLDGEPPGERIAGTVTSAWLALATAPEPK